MNGSLLIFRRVMLLGCAAVYPLVTAGAQSRPIPGMIPPPEKLADITVDPEVRARVDALRSDDFLDRQRAMHELYTARPAPEMLAALLLQGDLDNEQRSRILTLLRELMINSPRGALGIRMEIRTLEDEENRGIEVVDLIDGMPALHVLRVGDRISHIEDVPLNSSDDLVNLVQSRQPGDVVRLRLLRPKRTEDGGIERDANGRTRYDEVRTTIALGSSARLIDPTLRGTTTVSPVVARRTIEWNDLVSTYAPRPIVLLPSDSIRSDAPRQLFARTVPETTERLVDEHELIRLLRGQLTGVLEGRFALSSALVDQWERTHAEIVRRSRTADLPQDEREVLVRVADRYEELLRMLEIPRRSR